MKVDYFELLTKTIMWILGIIVIYMLILKITGHSPTAEAVIIAFTGIIVTNLLFLNYKIGRHEEKFNNIRKDIKESFERIKADLEVIKNQ